MTELLWMPAADGAQGTAANPNYVRAFEARVQKTFEDWALLDRTAFYAEGGGQPSDAGVLTWDGGEARVTHVSKRGAVKHVLEGDAPPVGALVKGEVDWALRYAHMRMHTSQHLLSGVVWTRLQGRTAGNQIHADRSRVDFARARLDDDVLRDLEREVNAVIRADLPIRVYEQDRSALETRLASGAASDRNLLDLVPQSVRRLRVVEIADPGGSLPDYGGSVDFCPCAGTHVARTGELGRMEILGRTAKGADKQRVEYTLA